MELANLQAKNIAPNGPQQPPCAERGPRARILDACGQLNVDGGHALDRETSTTTKQTRKNTKTIKEASFFQNHELSEAAH